MYFNFWRFNVIDILTVNKMVDHYKYKLPQELTDMWNLRTTDFDLNWIDMKKHQIRFEKHESPTFIDCILSKVFPKFLHKLIYWNKS